MENTQNNNVKNDDDSTKRIKNTKKNKQARVSRKVLTLKKYNIATKLEAVQAAKKMGNRPAARLFGVDEKRIRDWRKQEQSFEHQSIWLTRLPGAGRKAVMNEQLESSLTEFVAKLKATNTHYTNDTIAREARRLWSELVKGNPTLSKVQFKASKPYICKFLSRFNNPEKHHHRNQRTIPPKIDDQIEEEEDDDGAFDEEMDMSAMLQIELDS